jgi:hypothetical protein
MTTECAEKICAWVALFSIVLGSAAGCTHNFKVRLLPNDLNSPLLAMELLRTPDDLASVVGEPSDEKNNRKDMERLTKFDFAFIVAYACLFLAVGWRLWQRAHKWAGIVAIVTGCGAAAFDVAENLAILRTLECLCTSPRHVSLFKWSLTFIALLAASTVFIDRSLKPLRRSIGYLAAASCIAAGLFGLAGVAARIDPLVERGAALMGLGLVCGWLFFVTHSALSGGLVPALNRLAKGRALKWLSTWPSDDT